MELGREVLLGCHDAAAEIFLIGDLQSRNCELDYYL